VVSGQSNPDLEHDFSQMTLFTFRIARLGRQFENADS
jgi:hypothetical protein